MKQLETQGQLNFSLGPIKDFKRGQHRAQMLYLQLPWKFFAASVDLLGYLRCPVALFKTLGSHWVDTKKPHIFVQNIGNPHVHWQLQCGFVMNKNMGHIWLPRHEITWKMDEHGGCREGIPMCCRKIGLAFHQFPVHRSSLGQSPKFETNPVGHVPGKSLENGLHAFVEGSNSELQLIETRFVKSYLPDLQYLDYYSLTIFNLYIYNTIRVSVMFAYFLYSASPTKAPSKDGCRTLRFWALKPFMWSQTLGASDPPW